MRGTRDRFDTIRPNNAHVGDDLMLAIGRGIIPGVGHVHKYGRNPAIATGAFEAIWNGGGLYTGHPTGAAEAMEIFSSSTADNGATATGALTVTIQHLLDGDKNQMPDVTVTLNGQTPVSLGVQTYSRASRLKVITAGSTGANEGLLTLRHTSTTANIFAVMPIGYNKTMIVAYTVPAGIQGFFTGWFASWAKKQDGFSNVRLTWRPDGEVFQVEEEFTLDSAGSSYILRKYDVPKGPLLPKTDIVIIADVSVADTGIAAGFDLILIDV